MDWNVKRILLDQLHTRFNQAVRLHILVNPANEIRLVLSKLNMDVNGGIIYFVGRISGHFLMNREVGDS